MIYGQIDDESYIVKYLDANLENGIKQKNLDKILDIMNNYIDLVEEINREQKIMKRCFH